MRCYGKDGDDHEVRNTMSKVTGADESRAEGIAQPSPLIHESQLLSLLYQSASSQICPHGPVLVHLLVRTCAHRCCRLLQLSDSPIKRLGIRNSPSSMYDGCLKVTAWMSANRNRAKSLSDAPIRACSRFFVSANRSPWSRVQHIVSSFRGTKTYRFNNKPERNAVCSLDLF
jgi:hypothetical protein